MFNFYISVRQENAGRRWYKLQLASYVTNVVNKFVMILTLMKCCEE